MCDARSDGRVRPRGLQPRSPLPSSHPHHAAPWRCVRTRVLFAAPILREFAFSAPHQLLSPKRRDPAAARERRPRARREQPAGEEGGEGTPGRGGRRQRLQSELRQEVASGRGVRRACRRVVDGRDRRRRAAPPRRAGHRQRLGSAPSQPAAKASRYRACLVGCETTREPHRMWLRGEPPLEAARAKPGSGPHWARGAWFSDQAQPERTRLHWEPGHHLHGSADRAGEGSDRSRYGAEGSAPSRIRRAPRSRPGPCAWAGGCSTSSPR